LFTRTRASVTNLVRAKERWCTGVALRKTDEARNQ